MHVEQIQTRTRCVTGCGAGVQAEGTGGVQMNTKIQIYFQIQAERQDGFRTGRGTGD